MCVEILPHNFRTIKPNSILSPNMNQLKLSNFRLLIFYNTPMISARFHACGEGLQSRFSKGVSTN